MTAGRAADSRSTKHGKLKSHHPPSGSARWLAKVTDAFLRQIGGVREFEAEVKGPSLRTRMERIDEAQHPGFQTEVL